MNRGSQIPIAGSADAAVWNSGQPTDGQSTLPRVLLVEDDPELRAFLESILESRFRILLAENGLEGVNVATAQLPDLIVSDIMMPGMDGITLLKTLKTNIITSHIPVILLTAKSAVENKLEGLQFGADDYIVKPFSVPYFRERIRNLLNQRKHLQQLYRSQLGTSDPQLVPAHAVPVDKEFLDRIITDIETHLDDSDYSIDSLVKTTGLGRTVFFYENQGAHRHGSGRADP